MSYVDIDRLNDMVKSRFRAMVESPTPRYEVLKTYGEISCDICGNMPKTLNRVRQGAELLCSFCFENTKLRR